MPSHACVRAVEQRALDVVAPVQVDHETRMVGARVERVRTLRGGERILETPLVAEPPRVHAERGRVPRRGLHPLAGLLELELPPLLAKAARNLRSAEQRQRDDPVPRGQTVLGIELERAIAAPKRVARPRGAELPAEVVAPHRHVGRQVDGGAERTDSRVPVPRRLLGPPEADPRA